MSINKAAFVNTVINVGKRSKTLHGQSTLVSIFPVATVGTTPNRYARFADKIVSVAHVHQTQTFNYFYYK